MKHDATTKVKLNRATKEHNWGPTREDTTGYT